MKIFTFHYVSIISRSLFRPASPTGRFTFHYVSIISQICAGAKEDGYIYIPLCFYYFKNIASLLGDDEANLHSSMFLLFLRGAADPNISVRHLHSIMFLLFPME